MTDIERRRIRQLVESTRLNTETIARLKRQVADGTRQLDEAERRQVAMLEEIDLLMGNAPYLPGEV